MAHAFSSLGGSGVLLFDEDFDQPPAPPEPEVIQPLFTAAELMSARDEAARDSRDSALVEASDSTREAVSRSLAEIAAQIGLAREEAAATAEQSAEAIACLLFDCFATAFPALSARHGPGELAAVLREILPALHREPKITVRINPGLISQMTEELHALDPELAARVRLMPTDSVAPGEALINWENGTATRSSVSLWEQIEGILAPAGLLITKQSVKEHELVE